LPNQNQDPNVDASMPEPKNQASGRRRLLRNIVAVGAAAVGGFLLGDKTDLLPTVNAAGCTGGVNFYHCGTTTADPTQFFWNNTCYRLGIGTNNPQNPLTVGPNPCPAFNSDELLQVAKTSNAYMVVRDGKGTALLGTTCGLPFVGSQSNSDFTIRTNNSARVRVTSGGNVGIGTCSPNALLQVSGCKPNILLGDSHNSIGASVKGATVSGGGQSPICLGNSVTKCFGTVGGGYGNTASADNATVGGGNCNKASGFASTVGGGGHNQASSGCSTVGGGGHNQASGFCSTVGGGFSNAAAGLNATVGGGFSNTASGEYSTVPGGDSNTTGAANSFAAGSYANVLGPSTTPSACPPHTGAMLFSDNSNCHTFNSVGKNEFAVRAAGGFRFVTKVNACTGAPTQTTAISSSGFLGVGTATPEAPLTVVSCTSITAALIGSSQGNLIFAKSGTNGFSMYSNAANYLGFYSNDSGIQPLTMNGSGVAVGNAYKSTAPPTNGAIIEGSVGIGTSAPTQTLSVQGTAGKSCGGSTWATFSDRRWKCPDSIEPYTEGLAWVRSLPPPMRFRYAKGNGIGADPAKEHVNFVAQCLLDGVHSGMVNPIQAKVKMNDKEPTTTYAVNVSDMQFAMLNAIKEMDDSIKELAEQNQTLAEENATLKEQLAEQNQKLAGENKTLREELTNEDKAIRQEFRMLQDTVKRLAAS